MKNKNEKERIKIEKRRAIKIQNIFNHVQNAALYTHTFQEMIH